ncbi:GNAT family N-acetyltransferase [Streptomyces chartreusis]|uniref:GNAT family N-acetyltransferase n=1 Tax=Streptomyces chartreusis TaxID=1969 RepID=UPI002E190B95
MSDTTVPWTVEPMRVGDVRDVCRLLREADTSLGVELTAESIQRRRIRQWVLGPKPVMHVALARDDRGTTAGFATYCFLWPSEGHLALCVKILFVSSGHRRRGAGSALMRALHAEAAAHECTRVEWFALSDDAVGRAFCASLGARLHEGRICYTLPSTSDPLTPWLH